MTTSDSEELFDDEQLALLIGELVLKLLGYLVFTITEELEPTAMCVLGLADVQILDSKDVVVLDLQDFVRAVPIQLRLAPKLALSCTSENEVAFNEVDWCTFFFRFCVSISACRLAPERFTTCLCIESSVVWMLSAFIFFFARIYSIVCTSTFSSTLHLMVNRDVSCGKPCKAVSGHFPPRRSRIELLSTARTTGIT